MKPSTVTETLFDTLNYRAERQKVISANIANLNTPDYKTKDLSFEAALNDKNKERDLELFKTNSMHIDTTSLDEISESKITQYEVPNLQEQNDGNNVNLDSQMSEQAKNKIIFDAIQSSIKRDSRLFRSVVESSAKN